MTNPGQQLDERYEALAAKVAEQGGKISTLSQDRDEHDKILANLMIRVAELEGSMPEPEPDPEPDPEPGPSPDPTPPDRANAITPGGGWGGPTKTPPQIGSVKEPAVAHWAVVPEQMVQDGFTVGVIAYHLDGIDRVEISANSGPWVRIDNPSINPRTQSEEYWSPLDLSSHAGPIALRAIAYPKKGKPVLVEPLGKTYREQDLTLYAGNFVGRVFELPAGTHTIKPKDMPSKGWLIIRPKPGVDRNDCIITAPRDDRDRWGKGRVKLEGLTVRVPEGNGIMRGNFDRDSDGHYHGLHLWFDRCVIVGNPLPKNSNYITVAWESCTYTDCDISRLQNVFHSHGATKLFTRNNKIHDVYEDIYRASGLMVGDTIWNVDRGPLSKDLHPDIWQFQNLPNTIAQDITAVDNINAQGLFPKDISDTAIVRVKIKSVNPFREFAIEGEAENVLIKDSSFGGGQFRGSVKTGSRVVFENLTDADGKPWLPDGSDKPGVEVR